MMQANIFPPPEDFTNDGITHSPKILTRAVNSTGPDQLSQGEKGSDSPGFLLGYQEPKMKTSLPGFLSSDEAFTSRYGTPSASNFKTKTIGRNQEDKRNQNS
ncbi:unnamed protein product [Thlaspi arvense]|uniref:Uncharacterized protein n=1 Tax=Thlaspi arvense TaxID=13288 RepID=A0AAU9SA92_THLAR|nr:unnamed protein product [Thlaspi arvense]